MSPQDLSQLVDFLREHLHIEGQSSGLVLKLGDEVISEVPIDLQMHDNPWRDEQVSIRLIVGDHIVASPSIEYAVERAYDRQVGRRYDEE